MRFASLCVALLIATVHSLMRGDVKPTAFCRDISGDAVFVSQVREYRDKPWVNQTMIPYTPTPNPSHPHCHPHSPARSLPLNVALRVALSCPVNHTCAD